MNLELQLPVSIAPNSTGAGESKMEAGEGRTGCGSGPRGAGIDPNPLPGPENPTVPRSPVAGHAGAPPRVRKQMLLRRPLACSVPVLATTLAVLYQCKAALGCVLHQAKQ